MFFKFLLTFTLGIVGGLIISAYLPARVQYKGKIKQKGENNRIILKRDKKSKKRDLFKRNKRKKNKHNKT